MMCRLACGGVWVRSGEGLGGFGGGDQATVYGEHAHGLYAWKEQKPPGGGVGDRAAGEEKWGRGAAGMMDERRDSVGDGVVATVVGRWACASVVLLLCCCAVVLTSLKPFCSKRLMISPTRPRCAQASREG